MAWSQAIVAVSAVVTALSALGAFEFCRRAARDARWSRRALEGEAQDDGLIDTVEELRKQSRRNTRVLRREGLRGDGGGPRD